jgi:hypothetical protein
VGQQWFKDTPKRIAGATIMTKFPVTANKYFSKEFFYNYA